MITRLEHCGNKRSASGDDRNVIGLDQEGYQAKRSYPNTASQCIVSYISMMLIKMRINNCEYSVSASATPPPHALSYLSEHRTQLVSKRPVNGAKGMI